MNLFVNIALATTALVTAAAPAAAENYSFTHEGIRFEVQDTQRDGVRFIQGRDSSGATFEYRVRGNQVSGTYAGQPVFFTIPTTRVAKVAAR